MNTIKTIKVALIVAISLSFSMTYDQDQFRALLFTKTAGYHHESINAGVDALKVMSEKHFFKVDWHEDATRFSDKSLENYDVIIFLNTSDDILNDEQQSAMERFIRSGKGFVGLHAAADTEYDWEWYTKMIGMMFKIHPQIQTARLNVIDSNFPGMEMMPSKRLWTDEFYTFGSLLNDKLNYLITVDENSYKPNAKWGDNESTGMGDFHPISWYHYYDGGRAFYTALGHVQGAYSDDLFLEHLYGAIYWAATGNGMTELSVEK